MLLCTLMIVLAILFGKCSCLKRDLDTPIENTCLLCFCQALSDCNYEEKCEIIDDFSPCGPFHLTRDYWIEGEKNGRDLKSCAFDLSCINKTIQAYMKKHSLDCNNNGYLECGDYFRIHVFGKYNCHDRKIEKTFLWLKLMECYLNSVSNPREALALFKPLIG